MTSYHMASSNSNTLQGQENNLYQQWMNLQDAELSELLQTLELNSEGKITDSELTQLIQKITSNFEDYMEARSHLARLDPSPFYAPPWCTTLENSGVWVAGCRPTSFIRLIHALCGLEIEKQLVDSLKGVRHGNLGDLSHSQLSKLHEIQMKTVREERKLSTKLASLQENMADQPLAEVVRKPEKGCGSNRTVHTALDENGEAMLNLLKEADRLRLETLKDLIGMLTPVQGLQFIAAGKKLRICMREWGKKRDNDHGRCDNEIQA